MSDIEFRLRPAQEPILAYQGGRMAISAVPGAGKTLVLALLAARLVNRAVNDDQEVLVVTLVNSAVENIKGRIAEFVGRQGLLSSVGYRVRTLHGLANDIVRESPSLVGLVDDYRIVDEREAQRILEEVVEVWLQSHPEVAATFLSPELPEEQREWVARTQWPDTLNDMVGVFIKRAKDQGYLPADIQERLQSRIDGAEFSLARMCAEIYANYQKSLQNMGGVDFEDLIRLALQALDQDRQLLARLRRRWPYILEDEAQDSSDSQERMLRLLSGPDGNWVRVGDTNQAINTTFTTADSRHLHQFLQEPGVTALPLQNSGRSQQCIIDLANYLVEWTMHAHPEERVRGALHAPPFIEGTPPGDPQPNPEADPSGIHLSDHRFTPESEIHAVVRSLGKWLPDHQNDTVAVLVPRNQRGFELSDALRRVGIPYTELLRSTTSTRKTAGALGNVLQYLANPFSAAHLARVFEVWRRDDREEESHAKRMKRLSTLLRKCRYVEDYLWPRAGRDWLESIQWPGRPEPSLDAIAGNKPADQTTSRDEPDTQKGSTLDDTDRALLARFRELVGRWQQATVLPIDQLLLTIAQDLFIEPNELALSHKLAITLRAVSESNPSWRLPELLTELAVIARNQRRFLGFTEEDEGFEPRPGEVTVSTLHKAKGLEWDRVYIMSVNNYDFPSAQPHDEYISERWFVRSRLNLEAEALAQLQALIREQPYAEGTATRQTRLDYVAERLRLLYVGITRARKDLILTWNSGRSREPKQMAVPLISLHTWWEEHQKEPSTVSQDQAPGHRNIGAMHSHERPG